MRGGCASIWWPNKDQWRDEVENMQISVSIPNDLVDVSNGKFKGKTDLPNGMSAFHRVSYQRPLTMIGDEACILVMAALVAAIHVFTFQ